MNAFFKHSWDTLCRTSASLSCAVLLFNLLIAPAHALIDFNTNGVSDLWEMHYNSGELFSNFDANADPDSDGWTNAREAAAGTDPFDTSQPGGFFIPEITIVPATYHDPDEDGVPDILTPETATIIWPTVSGKLYTLDYSLDLSSPNWASVGDPAIGDGTVVGQAIVLTQPDGSRPDALFWRVRIQDVDSDGDQLSDAEERELGTNPHSASPDMDVVTSNYDVYYTGSDPEDYDPSEDGAPDPPAQIGGLPVPVSTYAPAFNWVPLTRGLFYIADEITAGGQTIFTGDLYTNAEWDSSLYTHTGLSARIPLANLSSMMPAFPAVATPTYNFGQTSYTNYSNVQLPSEMVYLQQIQFRLTASGPVAAPVTKRIMVVHRSSGGGANAVNIECKSFTIPANQAVSDPQILGTEFIPGGVSAVTSQCSAPEFKPGNLVNGEGWDNTGPELWQSVGIGEMVPSTVAALWNDFNAEITSQLEIVVAAGSGSTAISLSDIDWNANGCSFKIHGLLATPVSGAQIVLRLKADPTVIFDTMRVDVFAKRTIPVTIYYLWDSRRRNSWPKPVITNGKIIAALNRTYNKQANILFTLKSRAIIDLKRDPDKWGVQADEPLRFTNDGSFDNLPVDGSIPAFNAAWLLIQKHNPAPTKYTILIVNEFLDSLSMGGATTQPAPPRKDQTTFMPGNAAENSFGHEAGHALSLATRNAGPKGQHDLGNWPAEWNSNLADPSNNRVGLMHTHALTTVVPWIRREDWRAANLSATDLE